MVSVIDQPLSEFRSDLERLNQLLLMLQDLREFGGAATALSDSGDGFVNAAVKVRDMLRRHSSDVAVLSGSLLLYLCGRFEHFVRMDFQALCDGFSGKCSEFTALPKKMQKSIHWFTAEVSKDFAKYGFDEIQAFGFMASYVDNVKGAQSPLNVNSACLSVTSNSMRPDILSDLFKRIGVDNLWQEMSKQSVLKTFFETDKDVQAEKEAKAVLEEMMTSRNGIAHPTATPSFPAPEKIKRYLDYISVLSEALMLVTKTQLAAFKPEPVQAALGT